MQAIKTTYLSPTNTKGTRIRATVFGASKTVGYDYSLEIEANHIAAAKALCVMMNWNFSVATGQLADGSYVHVLVKPKREPVVE